MLISVAGKIFFLNQKKENFADKMPQLPSNIGFGCNHGKSPFSVKTMLS